MEKCCWISLRGVAAVFRIAEDVCGTMGIGGCFISRGAEYIASAAECRHERSQGKAK